MKKQVRSFNKTISLFLSVVMMVLAFGGGTLRAEWVTPTARIKEEQNQLIKRLVEEIQKVLTYDIPPILEEAPSVEETAAAQDSTESADTQSADTQSAETDPTEPPTEEEPRIDPRSLEALIRILNRQTEQQKQRYGPHVRELTTIMDAETQSVFRYELAADYETVKLWSEVSTLDNALFLSAFEGEEDPERFLNEVHQRIVELMDARKKSIAELDPAIEKLLPEAEQRVLKGEAMTLRDALAATQMSEDPEIVVNISHIDALLELLLPKIFLDPSDAGSSHDAGPSHDVEEYLTKLSGLRPLNLIARQYNGVLMESRYIDINDELLNLVRDKLSAWTPQTEPNATSTHLRKGLLLLESYTLLGTWIQHSSKSQPPSPVSDEALSNTWGETYEFVRTSLDQVTEHDILTQKQAVFRDTEVKPLPVTGFHAELRDDGLYLEWDIPEEVQAPDYYVIYEVIDQVEQRITTTSAHNIRLDKPASGSHHYIVYSVNLLKGVEIFSEIPYQRGSIQVQIPEPTTTPEATTLVEPTLTETSETQPTTTFVPDETTKTTTTLAPTTLTETSVTEAPTTLAPTTPEPPPTPEPTTEVTTEPSTERTVTDEITEPSTEETTVPTDPIPEERPPFEPEPLPEPTEPAEGMNLVREENVSLEPVAAFDNPSADQQAIIEGLSTWVEGSILYVDVQDFDGDGLSEAFVLVEKNEQEYQLFFVPHEGDVQQVPGNELMRGLDPQNRYHHLQMDGLTLIYWISDVEGENQALLTGLREGEVHHFIPSAHGDFFELFDPNESTTLPAASDIEDPSEDFPPLGAQKFVLFTSQENDEGMKFFEREYFVFDLDAREFIRLNQPLLEDSDSAEDEVESEEVDRVDTQVEEGEASEDDLDLTTELEEVSVEVSSTESE